MSRSSDISKLDDAKTRGERNHRLAMGITYNILLLLARLGVKTYLGPNANDYYVDWYVNRMRLIGATYKAEEEIRYGLK